MSSTQPQRTTVWIALFLAQLLFALSYIFSKVLMETFPPLVWAFIRTSVTALLLFPIALTLKRPRPKLTPSFLKSLLIYSLLGGALTQGLYLVGLHYTSSTNSSILYTLSPLMTLATVIWIGQERATPLRLLGFLISFLGVLILSHAESYHLSHQRILGDCLTLLSCLSYGLFIALSKPFFEKYDSLWITTGMFTVSGLIFGGFAIPQFPSVHLPGLTLSFVSMIAFGIIGSTLMTYFLVIWTLSRAPSSQVALFGYLQPILTSLISWIYLGEVISERTLLAAIFILVGVSFTIEWNLTKSISQAHET